MNKPGCICISRERPLLPTIFIKAVQLLITKLSLARNCGIELHVSWIDSSLLFSLLWHLTLTPEFPNVNSNQQKESLCSPLQISLSVSLRSCTFTSWYSKCFYGTNPPGCVPSAKHRRQRPPAKFLLRTRGFTTASWPPGCSGG